jgi:hypothetical protein
VPVFDTECGSDEDVDSDTFACLVALRLRLGALATSTVRGFVSAILESFSIWCDRQDGHGKAAGFNPPRPLSWIGGDTLGGASVECIFVVSATSLPITK